MIDIKSDGLDWTGRGYSGATAPAGVDPADRGADPWLRWAAILGAAREGDFGPTALLIRLYEEAPDPVFEGVCCALLGDAAPSGVIDGVARALDVTQGFEATLDFSDIVCTRGRLGDVPLLLRAYERVADIEDAEILPISISTLLESRSGPLGRPEAFSSVREYGEAVMRRYQDRADKFGTDAVLVLHGERFGVVRLAERILRELPGKHFPEHLRRRFEASTGIDCSAFYRGGVVQPGDAAKIVERFLDGHDSERYQDGARYFFGHRIPE